jgi:hypothetical protein
VYTVKEGGGEETVRRGTVYTVREGGRKCALRREKELPFGQCVICRLLGLQLYLSGAAAELPKLMYVLTRASHFAAGAAAADAMMVAMSNRLSIVKHILEYILQFKFKDPNPNPILTHK